MGELELHYPKKIFGEREVEKKKEEFEMPEHWKVEQNHKDFILKFRPPKLKVLKQFRELR